jgi:hypothetical protein
LLGTTTSYTKLTVSNGLSARTGITLSDANTASLMLFAGASQGAVISTDSIYQDLIFKRGSNVGTENGTETMRIDGSGRLGIGTNSPLQRLHVQGNLLVAAGAATGQHITQKPYELNGGTLSWEGSAGQLFSITNNLTSGSIFSVNDVSGIPSIDVDANGTIQLGAYGGNVGIGVTNPSEKMVIAGNTIPSADATYNLGSSIRRWANVYTTDLQLSNEGSQNDVDGTWGQYTIQEGEEDLFLINRRNGKKYKFLLQEVV